MRLLHILSVSVLFFLPKQASANYIPAHEQQLFIESWANQAVDQMRLYGIPASITLAQAIVESGWGRGYVAIGGNNYFCIKSNNGWAGPTVKTMDDELDSSSFRKYLSIEESFTDHSKFLRGNSRYRPLFGLEATDYRAWAYGLKACGYATKADYAEQLIATIEKYGLYLYDYAVPAEQIKSLGLPFDQTEEAVPPPANAPSFGPPATDNLKISEVPTSEGQHLLSVPGYRLGLEPASTLPSRPALEATDAKPSVKIPLMMPEAAPRFERR